MKLNFGKRLVLFLHWLLALAGCAMAVLYCAWPSAMAKIISGLNGLVGQGNAVIIGYAALAVYVVFAVAAVIILFSGDRQNRSERGFIIVDSNEGGRIRIAIGAVEQMIRQAVRCVDGITDMKAGIVNNDDAISINTSVSIVNGAHVPSVTMNIQRAIRSYIELNCGVAVREVSVSVQALNNGEGGRLGRKKAAAEAVAPVVPMTPAVPVAEPVVEPVVEPVAEHAEPVVEPENAAESQPETEEIPVEQE